MDLLERYLQAVRFFLPRPNQDDIVRELSENLVSQMEDLQEQLGRPLREDELADLLRKHGHPMLVAGRYRSHQQLIGPVFFPIYLFALKAGLAAAAIVTVLTTVVSALLHGDAGRQVLNAFLGLPGRALMVFAWTTLSFAALDIAQSRLKLPTGWDPKSLPKVVRREDRISRVHSLCELLLTAGCIVWLLLVPQETSLVMGPAAAFLDLAPVWGVVYLPMLLLTAATLILSLVNFLRPYWTPGRSLARLAIHAGGAIVCILLLRGGVWVIARPDAHLADVEGLRRLVDVVNMSCKVGLAVAFIVTLIELVKEARRLKSGRTPASPSDSTRAHVAG